MGRVMGTFQNSDRPHRRLCAQLRTAVARLRSGPRHRASEKTNRLQPALFVLGVGEFFFRRDRDNQQNVPCSSSVKRLEQNVVNHVLAPHGVHPAETLQSDDANDPVLVAEFHLIRGWEAPSRIFLSLRATAIEAPLFEKPAGPPEVDRRLSL